MYGQVCSIASALVERVTCIRLMLQDISIGQRISGSSSCIVLYLCFTGVNEHVHALHESCSSLAQI